ncbi:IclR family transcriptional regulator [Saccharopolyspora sp. TS4A08]|uniref:IclR family transcriptional regulator n=1 Tax=Saccharopolyspora ipomoeae TaxID=3042027 RepID=A0ABT6PNH5_9PSEU|nr:IclR family transcriptional regulator [Saccharopolyspora sp. TS4A08]MDI2029562.1 IclR family transcriptional regulator [Saccharopolyspora sp. TS4A08]
MAAALQVLRLLADNPDGLGITDVARSLEMSKSKAHLLLATLLEQGFADRAADSRYRVGLTAFEVGSAVPDAARFGGDLLTPMRALADLSGEAVSLAVPRNRDAIMVQRFETKHVLRAEIGVGTRMPLISCASGKFLLAHMTDEQLDSLYPTEALPYVTVHSVRTKTALRAMFPEVRDKGYALNDEEYAEGIAGVATGVADASGHYVAALSVAGPSSRFRADDWIEPLAEAARKMTELLASRR